MYITDSTSQLGTIGKPAGLMAGSSGKIVFLLSRMSPVIRRCAGAVAVREVDPRDLVETLREGLLVLDSDLTIRFANRSFCDTFAVAPEDAVGRKLYELGNGQWDIPELRSALETIISGGKSIEAFEVDRFFPSIGRRAMVLNARKVYRPGNKVQQILLAIDDVTEQGDSSTSMRLRTSVSRCCCRSSATGSKTACRSLLPWSVSKRGTTRAARAKRRLRGYRIASPPSGNSIPC